MFAHRWWRALPEGGRQREQRTKGGTLVVKVFEPISIERWVESIRYRPLRNYVYTQDPLVSSLS